MMREREKGEANDFAVSFSALCNDVVNVLNFMEMLKNEEDQIAVYVPHQIEVQLAFICTYVQLSCSDLEEFDDIMRVARQHVEYLLRRILDDVDNKVRCKYNMHHVLPSLMYNIYDCINSWHRSKLNATMTDEELNFLLLNIHHLSKHLAENMRYFHGLIVNGFVEHEIAEYVLPQFQVMAERVGDFLCEKLYRKHSQVLKLPHLFLKIIPIELEVSFSALRKDVATVLDFMERFKNEENQIAVDVADDIEDQLAFICTYVYFSYCDLEQFEVKMSFARRKVGNLLRQILDDVDNNITCKYNMHHVLRSLMDNIDDCINSCHHSKLNAIMTDEQLNFLLLNIHHLSKFVAEKMFPSVPEYQILRNVCGKMRDFHGLIVNGFVDHEIAEYVLPQFQVMAERVGDFLWDERCRKHSLVLKLAHLFLKIIPIELEVSFSALRNDVATVLDFMQRLKNEEYQIAVDVADDIEDQLAFICTYVQLSYCDLEQFEVKMSSVSSVRWEVWNLLRQILDDVDNNITCKYNMHHVLCSLMDNIDDCINSCHRSKLNATMTDEQLNFLLLNIHHLSKHLAEKISPSVPEYQILQNVCGNMRDFHGLIVNGFVDHEIAEYVLPQFQVMAERVGDFLWNERYRKHSHVLKLAHLFLKIIPIELEVMHMCFTNLKASTSAETGYSLELLREYLIHLQEHMVAVLTPRTSGARNIHVMIEFLLVILTDMPKDFIHHDRLFDLLARVGALTRKVSILVRVLEEKSWTEESTSETNDTTLDLLKDIELLKKDLRHVYLKAPVSYPICFPMSDGQLFMHLLLMHLNDLLDSNSYSTALIKKEIGLVKKHLKSIRSFLENVEQGLHKDLWKCVLNVAYEAKDVIDSIIARDNGLLHLIFSLPLTIKNLKLIKEEVSNLHEKIPKNSSINLVNSPNKFVENKSSLAGKIIVGFEEETNLIVAKLTRGPADLDVISITGMPGSGKTTLAYRVYNDKSVSSHFDLRAWCTVDQSNDKKELLEKIFNQVTSSDSKFGENCDIADKLRKQLFGKRYLIVLDDLWDTDSVDELTRPFPDVEKGSRIILTTRQKEVALHGKRHCDPLNLRLLRPEESWELLEKRVFGKESCPDELLDVGKKIAQNCKGLPLVADLIAGVIAGLEKKKTLWLEIQSNLSSFILNSEVDVMKVIELSYNHLPVQVKPCFLYLGCYPKDTSLEVKELKEKWHGEGLVERTEMKSVEEVMEIYLDNLISSNLVIHFNEIGEVRTCQLHDLVHDFGFKKAREEKFFDRISSHTATIVYDKEHFGHNNFVLFDSKRKRYSGKHLYSLGISGGKLDKNLSYVGLLRHLRPLRVLYLDDSFINVKDLLLNEICMLNHLRYLDIGTKVKSLPSSFSNLWNLETLVVRNEGSTLVLLPRIWDLIKLRLLDVNACSFFDLDAEEPILIAENSKLENLTYFRGLTLSYLKDTEDIFKRLPNLQLFQSVVKESWDYSTGRYWFPKLDFLTELETLIVEFESSNTNDCGPSVETNWSWDFHFPSNLKTLGLIDFPMAADSLSTIGRLPNLEELILIRAIIHGEEWNMGEEATFKKLKYLYLEKVNLAKWEVGEESFPMLEKLELMGCRKLEEIPPRFGDICSLKVIKLVLSPHLEESAKNIKEYVEDMGGEFQILGRNDIPLFK